MDEAIKARNAEIAVVRDALLLDAPRPGADWSAHLDAVAEWKRATGFDAAMKRAGDAAFERHGFVRVPEGGWRFDG